MDTPNQRVAFLGQITPSSAPFAAGSAATGWIDTRDFEQLLAIVQVGTIAGAGTVNVKFQHASTSVGGGSADISSACVTSTFASTDNNEIGGLVLQCGQHPEIQRYVRAVATIATSTWAGGVIVEGHQARYEPASDYGGTLAPASNFVVY